MKNVIWNSFSHFEEDFFQNSLTFFSGRIDLKSDNYHVGILDYLTLGLLALPTICCEHQENHDVAVLNFLHTMTMGLKTVMAAIPALVLGCMIVLAHCVCDVIEEGMGYIHSGSSPTV